MAGLCRNCGPSASKASTWIGGWRPIVGGAVVVRNAESARWASPPNDAPRSCHPGTGCARIDGGSAFPQVNFESVGSFRRFVQFVGAHQWRVLARLSTMRSPLGGFGWGVLVEVDEGAVFALCFPRSQNGAVRFYESAGRSKPVRGCRSIMGAGVGVRNADSCVGHPTSRHLGRVRA